MSTTMDLNKALQREDIVPWIGEFSYIFSSGLFDLEESQLPGGKENYPLQEPPKVEAVVLDTVSQFSDECSDTTTTPHSQRFQWGPPCADAHILEVDVTESGGWGTQCIETDGEFLDHSKPNPFYCGGGLGSGKNNTRHGKWWWRRRKLFGGRRGRKLHSEPPTTDSSQSFEADRGRDSRKPFRLLGAGSYLSLRHPDQPEEHRPQSYSPPMSDHGTVEPLQRRSSSRHRVTRKPGLCPLRDSWDLNQNRTEPRASSATSAYSWLSDVKDCLKSLSPGSPKRKASTLSLQDKVSRASEDSQDTPPRVHPLRRTDDFMSTQTLPLPQHISRGTSTGSKTLTVEFNAPPCVPPYSDSRKRALEMSNEATPTSPQSYQCTFCLAQCTSKLDWMQHERTYHFQVQQWESTSEVFSDDQASRSSRPPSQHSSDTCVTRSCGSHRPSTSNGLDEPMNDLFWNCGFCNFVLRSWDERQEHIAHEHFEQGTNMSLWDPLKAPYPWKRRIGAPIPGFSAWGLEELLAIQKPELTDSMERNCNPDMQKASVCKLCHLPAKDQEAAAKHKEMWHKPRNVWSCPAAFSPDDTFFDTSRRSDGSIRDICLCCGKSFKYSQRDPEILMRHLRNAHGFDEYPCLQMCFDKEQFYLHLANSHDFYLEFIQDFMVSCEWRGRAPAMMLESY